MQQSYSYDLEKCRKYGFDISSPDDSPSPAPCRCTSAESFHYRSLMLANALEKRISDMKRELQERLEIEEVGVLASMLSKIADSDVARCIDSVTSDNIANLDDNDNNDDGTYADDLYSHELDYILSDYIVDQVPTHRRRSSLSNNATDMKMHQKKRQLSCCTTPQEKKSMYCYLLQLESTLQLTSEEKKLCSVFRRRAANCVAAQEQRIRQLQKLFQSEMRAQQLQLFRGFFAERMGCVMQQSTSPSKHHTEPKSVPFPAFFKVRQGSVSTCDSRSRRNTSDENTNSVNTGKHKHYRVSSFLDKSKDCVHVKRRSLRSRTPQPHLRPKTLFSANPFDWMSLSSSGSTNHIRSSSLPRRSRRTRTACH